MHEQQNLEKLMTNSKFRYKHTIDFDRFGVEVESKICSNFKKQTLLLKEGLMDFGAVQGAFKANLKRPSCEACWSPNQSRVSIFFLNHFLVSKTSMSSAAFQSSPFFLCIFQQALSFKANCLGKKVTLHTYSVEDNQISFLAIRSNNDYWNAIRATVLIWSADSLERYQLLGSRSGHYALKSDRLIRALPNAYRWKILLQATGAF